MSASMAAVRVAVRLKAADPAARTALLTLERLMPADCPLVLDRYDLWEFDTEPGKGDMVGGILGRFTDIVNPNKQVYAILDDGGLLDGEDPSLTWVSVEVEDHGSSASDSWSSVVARAGYRVFSVRSKVLWRLGFAGCTTPADALRKAGAVAVAVTRTAGLLANPVSQTALVRLSSGAAGELALN
jgi:hypothetical protein